MGTAKNVAGFPSPNTCQPTNANPKGIGRIKTKIRFMPISLRHRPMSAYCKSEWIL